MVFNCFIFDKIQFINFAVDVSHSEMERLCVTNSVVSEWSDSDNEPLANKLNQPQPTVTDVVEILPPPEPHVNDSGSIAVLRSSCNDDSNQRQSSGNYFWFEIFRLSFTQVLTLKFFFRNFKTKHANHKSVLH